MKHLNELSAREAALAIATRKISSEELVTACLERIRQREPEVGAWVCLDEDKALREARQCDAGPANGPLHGVPIGVKDNIDTFEFPTQYGSRVYEGHRPPLDAACIGLLRRAGGIIMGKTVTTEFAMFEPNKTRNPHNPLYTPGGSSSGSASAVADFHIPLALGSQSAGSIIRPAAFCGVVGYKPTINTFVSQGIKPLGASLDTLGVISRCVDDLLLMWDALQGQAVQHVTALPAQPRIGLCRTPFWHKALPEQRAALDFAGQQLAQNGFEVQEVVLPASFDELNDVHGRLMAYEVARNYAYEYDSARRDLLAESTRERFEFGWSITPDEYLSLRAIQRQSRQEFEAFCQDMDALLVPSTTGVAPAIKSTGDPIFNSIWTLLGVPAVTLPVGSGTSGLPLGVQFVARTDADLALLALCRTIESVFSECFVFEQADK